MLFVYCQFSAIVLRKCKPNFTWPGLLITLTGVPFYFAAVRNKKQEKGE